MPPQDPVEPVDAQEIPVEKPEVTECDIYATVEYTEKYGWCVRTASPTLTQAQANLQYLKPTVSKLFRLRSPASVEGKCPECGADEGHFSVCSRHPENTTWKKPKCSRCNDTGKFECHTDGLIQDLICNCQTPPAPKPVPELEGLTNAIERAVWAGYQSNTRLSTVEAITTHVLEVLRRRNIIPREGV